MVVRCAALEVIREQHAPVFQGEAALESSFRQLGQGVAAFVSGCYAECQALGVDFESDCLDRCQASWSIACAWGPPSVDFVLCFCLPICDAIWGAGD